MDLHRDRVYIAVADRRIWLRQLNAGGARVCRGLVIAAAGDQAAPLAAGGSVVDAHRRGALQAPQSGSS